MSSIIAVLLFSPFPIHAAETLSGDPFTDHSYVQPMDEDWIGLGIDYEPDAAGADIVLSLDQHLYPAMHEIIETYGVQNKLKIVVNEGTCGTSAGLISKKAIDIAGFCCPPSLADRLPGLIFHTIGIIPLAIIVNSKNPLSDITVEQARLIFQGKIKNWSEVTDRTGKRGPNIPISVIGRLHCKQRPGHWRLILDKDFLFSPMMKEVGTIPDMIELVSNNRASIGYEVTMWMKYGYIGKSFKALKIDGMDPQDLVWLLKGEYPFYRVLNATTWEGSSTNNPRALRLVKHMIDKAILADPKFDIVPASRLKHAQWLFKEDELIGQPPKTRAIK